MTSRARPRVLIAAPAFQPWDLGTYVGYGLDEMRIPHATFAYDRFRSRRDADRAFVECARTSGAEVVLGLKLEGVTAQAIRAVRRTGVRVVLWQVDCFDGHVPPWIVPRAREVDAMAVTAHGMVDAYASVSRRPVRWIMEGAYLPAFPPVPMSAGAKRLYGSDIAFVGGVMQPPADDRALAIHRRRLLARLAKSFTVKVWGPQRPAVAAWAKRAGVDLARWPAYNDELSRIARASTIVLGTNTINTIHQYFSNRTFLTLAAGGFHVTHYVPGLEELFDNHRHLVWYHDDGECEETCKFYLKRATARTRIAEAGRARVRTRWKLTGQVAKLMELARGSADA